MVNSQLLICFDAIAKVHLRAPLHRAGLPDELNGQTAFEINLTNQVKAECGGALKMDGGVDGQQIAEIVAILISLIVISIHRRA